MLNKKKMIDKYQESANFMNSLLKKRLSSKELIFKSISQKDNEFK